MSGTSKKKRIYLTIDAVVPLRTAVNVVQLAASQA